MARGNSKTNVNERAQKVFDSISSGGGKWKALREYGMSDATYTRWLESQGSTKSVQQEVEPSTLVGRLLHSNLADTDKIALLRAAYR